MKKFNLKNNPKKVATLSLVSLCMVFLCSCPVPDTSPTLSGTVSDAETNALIAGAQVAVSENNLSVITSADGFYEFPKIGSGSYTLTISHSDYETLPASVILDEDDVTHNIRLVLKKYTLTGTVKDSKTDALLQGVSVKPSSGPEKITGQNGAYTLDGMAKGQIFITFSKAGYKDKTEQVNIPDVNTLTTLLEPSVAGLTGTIIDKATGVVLSDVTVALDQNFFEVTGANGKYTFENLTKTSYNITASKTGYEQYGTSISLNLGESNTHNIQMEKTYVPPTASLSGVITDAATGATLPDVTLTLNPGGYVATTSANGAYTFSGLTGMSYQISASKSGYQTYGPVTVSTPNTANTHNIQMETVPVATKTLSGTVTSGGSALSGVSITLNPGNLTYTTSSGGTYTFSGLTETSYQISASKSGYQAYGPVTVSTPNTANTHNISMTQETSSSNAKVTVSSSMSISDQIYAGFSFNSYTAQYVVLMWESSYISSASDEEIIDILKANGSANSTSNTGIYIYNLSPSTSYTICAVGMDTQGKYGTLTRQTVSTKSSSNQPRVSLTISKSGNNIHFSTSRNSYCSSYKLWIGSLNYDAATLDIVYAMAAYSDGQTETENYGSNSYFALNSSYSHSLVIALGYNSSGVNSGFVDVKIINNSSGTVVRSAQIDLRSLNKEEIQQMEAGKIDGKFAESLIKFDSK
ncbi:MAG: carboxypeptidase regulatory-like domain-containing protein [Tannerella sp.]|jgi:hypothetical protein|nr:carboxypeptidase regulatory-like domain-containing protein [Tannerella sp.]